MKTSKKQWLGLLIIPLELLIGSYLFPPLQLTKNPGISLISSTLLFLAGFLVMMYLFHDFLKEQWLLFRQKLLFKLLLSILLVIGAFLILHVVREIIPNELLSSHSSSNVSSDTLNPWWMLLASIPPFIAPFTEELTFRYLLLGKISKHIFRVVMLVVQGILFGFVHWNNFNGNVYAMIPYMIIGIYFGIIYLINNNIWSSIMIHWLLNTMNSVLPVLVILILSLFGITLS